MDKEQLEGEVGERAGWGGIIQENCGMKRVQKRDSQGTLTSWERWESQTQST